MVIAVSKFVANAARRIARNKAADWSVICIVPPGLGFRMNQLHQFDPRGFKDQVRGHIEATELPGAPAAGSIGFACKAASGALSGGPTWSLSYAAPLQDVFARHCPPRQSTPRPVYVRVLDKAALLINGVSNTDTAKAELEGDQWYEIAPLLHEWDFGGRLICQNWRVA